MQKLRYENTGLIVGVITKMPVKLSDTVLTLMVKVEEPIVDEEGPRNRKMFPDFVAYQETIEKVENAGLSVGAIVRVKYTQETKRKLKHEKNVYFKNSVIQEIEVIGHIDTDLIE